MLRSMLYGHVRGTFAGANKRAQGINGESASGKV
ncbi:hypothetical protein EH223_01470 [candidate division KSB1 bacterium]|nr:sigma 54-interacting transcriptional regulator [candidate division KSB1 bacterium]RQW06868.1 MAG: hypothetical protein EH223_01470 [candidate division KSB1 bacterium]